MTGLRKALIEIAGHMGIPLSEQNSDGFLSAVSEEVRLTFARLTRERDEYQKRYHMAMAGRQDWRNTAEVYQRERDEARAMLRELEWSGGYGPAGGCPICGAPTDTLRDDARAALQAAAKTIRGEQHD